MPRILAGLLAITAAWLVLACVSSAEFSVGEPTIVLQAGEIDVRIRDVTIRAELATTPAERSQGLSDRETLAPDAGMLFVYDAETTPSFTMRRMRFPLDFIWISAGRRVVDLTQDVPPPAAPGQEVDGLRPASAVQYVLEVNAGLVEEAGISVGDEVSFGPDALPGDTP